MRYSFAIKKFFVFMSTLSTLYFVLCTSVQASGEFSTDFVATYEVKESGITEVTNQISITNLVSNIYATSYSVVLDSILPTNVKAYGIDRSFPVKTSTEDNLPAGKAGKTTIRVDFPDTVVGKDKVRLFWISFEETSFAVRTGEVWEISIPRIAENASFGSYTIKILVPEKFGQEAYISPTPKNKSIENGFIVYNFSKEDVEKTGIVAGFGAFQVFTFNLSYHLENPLSKSAVTEITLPPDTAYQKMYYSDIAPKPYKMHVDIDGNWIAEYKLDPRQRIDVTATGQVQIFSNYRPFLKPSQESLNNSLLKSEYWDIDDPQIIEIAKSVNTPKKIYDFVSNKLEYDYTRVKANVERLGAVGALNNPLSAICMEFTDLFVTLARASGISAREINGYAYTENPEIQPLSLVNDVLHAWPEYYDKNLGVWIPVDPTWGSTTGGVDYFNKLDLRHFTFVVHGADSKSPYAAGSYKLGANPQKDVFVNFGSLPSIRNSKIEMIAKPSLWIPFVPNIINFSAANNGPVAIYNLNPQIYFDNVETSIKAPIEILLPFQEYKSYINVPFSFLGAKTPDLVRIVANDDEIKVTTNKSHVIIYNLLFVFLVSIAILLTILFRLKKWKFLKKNS